MQKGYGRKRPRTDGGDGLMFTKDRSFYKQFFSLYWMLVLQNVIVLSVNLADNVMLGRYHVEAAISGASAVNQIQFLLQSVVNGVGDGLIVLASQYWGQRRTEPIVKLSSVAMRWALAIAAALFVLVSCIPYKVVGLFTGDAQIIEQGVQYLSIIRFTYLIFAVTTTLLATLRSVQTVRIAFYISISTLVVNCSINYILIFGRLGAPEMGIKGAAVGTLVARAIELVIVVAYLWKKDDKLRVKLKDYLHVDATLLKDYFKVSLPIILVAGMWGASTGLQTVILGHMNKYAIAANSVASTLNMVLKVAATGAATSAAIIIGKAVGIGDMGKIREYTRTLQAMFLVIAVFTGVTLFFVRVPVLSFYTLSDKIKQMANSFLLVMCVTSMGTAYQMPTITGIIRGGGDTRFCLINDIVSIWLIVLPLSALGAFVFGWPPAAVVACLNSDQVFKGVVGAIKCNSYSWVRSLTR